MKKMKILGIDREHKTLSSDFFNHFNKPDIPHGKKGGGKSFYSPDFKDGEEFKSISNNIDKRTN